MDELHYRVERSQYAKVHIIYYSQCDNEQFLDIEVCGLIVGFFIFILPIGINWELFDMKTNCESPRLYSQTQIINGNTMIHGHSES
jgi:hypothetical protein